MSSTYRDLIAWQKAMKLVTAVYAVTAKFPSEELYGLTSQMRRCAVSIPSNIAEGQGRVTVGEFRQFLGNARGSILELQTQVEIARELDFLDKLASGSLMKQSDEVLRILNGLIMSISKN